LARSFVTYDAHQVHEASTQNELNHVVHTAHDLGTGALLSTRGPNFRPCGQDCTDWEETRTDIDGFGRPLRVYVNVENATTGRYESKLIERFTYFDAEQPQRVREERLIDFSADAWVTTDTLFDGFGRLRSRITFRFEPGKADAVATYRYDAEGRLSAVTVPDPSQDTSAVVEYGYTYDSLGRIKRLVRPGGSAIQWSYNGLRTTRTEVAATGPAAETITVRDVFDRLIQVDERLDDGTLASTTYAYDALDNVRRVTNPDGVITDLAHDWLSRRTRITRGSRVWNYEYDLNGNLLREIAPVPAGASQAAYTTSTVYDDVDRPSSRLAGVRALTPADQTEINHGLVQYTYDEGQTGKGRLTRVESKDAVRVRAFTHDVRGNVVADTAAFNLQPALGVAIADARTQHRTYNALGEVSEEWLGDGLDQGTSTHTLRVYDRRGLPWILIGPDNALTGVAVTTRNTAGLTTKIEGRQVTHTSSYDSLGRLTGTHGTSTLAPNVLLSETLTYFGHDDPATLVTFREGLGTHTFTFDFDRRHQLIGAASDRGYDALFAYTKGGRLQTAFVDAPTGAPLAPPRDVTYEYSGITDPEAVTRLASAPDDSTFVAYDHDLSGNVVRRQHASGQSFNFLYDGEDWQCRATAPDGSTELYYYDHADQRFLTVTRQPGGAVTKVRLVLGNLDVEYDGAGAAAETTVHLALERPVADIVNRGTPQRVIHGHLGNLLGAFEPSPTALAVAYIYGPFGERLAQSGDTADFIHRFNGEEQDDFTSLSYYGYRYFDPYSLGWTQADPLFRFAPDLAWDQPRRSNLYAFSLNNPLRYRDPDGQNPAIAVAFERAAVAAAAAAAAAAALAAQAAPVMSETVSEAADAVKSAVTTSVMDDMLRKAQENEPSGDGKPPSPPDQGPSPGQVAGGTAAVAAADAARRITRAIVSKTRHPESAAHIQQAQKAGKPTDLTIDRKGASTRRREAQDGTKPVPGRTEMSTLPPCSKKVERALASSQSTHPTTGAPAPALARSVERCQTAL
jgi:RHS repeat-associated protein